MRKSKFNYELTTQFIHPYTKEKLYYDNEMSLCDTKGHLLFRRVNNSYDFVINLSADRIHYDEQYDNRNNLQLESLSQITELWSKEPCQNILFDSLGTLNGKRILLLGNGMSLKELIFLLNGAELIYTDISWHAIAAIKKVIEENNIFKNMMHKIEFHSVDALNLPFDENQFDVIYGYAFVHHLENTEAFLKEVHRCLKPSGICRFMDDGYSPIWQGAKNTILKPLQVYSHKHKGISPEDLVATKRGGFKKEQILLWGKQLSFENVLYRKISFFEYLLNRGIEKLDLKPLKFFKPYIRKIDNFLLRKTNFIATNGIRLVWGYTKPKISS